MKRGKKSQAWDRARAKLKVLFERADVTTCEICGGTFGLSFAHRLKRRFITTPEELLTVALLCQTHHNELEVLPHSEMYERITAIINSRTQPI
jgi:hypothetical protein